MPDGHDTDIGDGVCDDGTNARREHHPLRELQGVKAWWAYDRHNADETPPSHASRGTSADEQLRVYAETNELKAVDDRLMDLTMENVPRNVNLTVGKTATARSTIAK